MYFLCTTIFILTGIVTTLGLFNLYLQQENTILKNEAGKCAAATIRDLYPETASRRS